MICSLYSFSEVEMSLMTGSSITKVPSNFRVSPQERKSLQYPRLLKLSTSALGAFPPNIPLIHMQHLQLSYSPSDSHKSLLSVRLLTTDSVRRRLLGRRLSATECWAPGLRTGAARGTAHHPLHYQCPGACALCPGYVQHYLVSRCCY